MKFKIAEKLSAVWGKDKSGQILTFDGNGLGWREQTDIMPLDRVVAYPCTFYELAGFDMLFTDQSEEEIEEWFDNNDEEVVFEIDINDEEIEHWRDSLNSQKWWGDQ